ncbi:MAG: diacylglycerol kinase family lipid kinase [Chloroflexi bacterium]|nr:MAG: diacylglycerol kinase family lipid kinase [Chloroflexota bacterium]TMG71951.1 MAG: diacylglycerol kinase family lipid kinase [Chloroflexota bacterium]
MSDEPALGDARALAIINPAAGKGAGERMSRRIAEDFRAQGLKVDIVRTPARDEAARLAREGAADGYRTIVAVGGDGTANEIANGLVGSGAVLALYPIGSGNDLARALGYPRRRRDVLKFLRGARRRSIDVGEVNGRVFVNAAGVGIDGHVAARVAAAIRVVGPTFGYLAGALLGVATYRPQPMRVLVDGELRSGRFLTVVAANGTHFGAGMRVAPDAVMDDGQLDVLLAGDLSRAASLVALAKLYRGTHIDGRTIVLRRARVVEIELERPLAMELDGEVSSQSRLSIRIRPRALQVLSR